MHYLCTKYTHAWSWFTAVLAIEISTAWLTFQSQNPIIAQRADSAGLGKIDCAMPRSVLRLSSLPRVQS